MSGDNAYLYNVIYNLYITLCLVIMLMPTDPFLEARMRRSLKRKRWTGLNLARMLKMVAPLDISPSSPFFSRFRFWEMMGRAWTERENHTDKDAKTSEKSGAANFDAYRKYERLGLNQRNEKNVKCYYHNYEMMQRGWGWFE